MKRFTRILFICLLPLLPACSIGEREAGSLPTRTPRAQAASSQPATNVPGKLLYVSDNQIWLHSGREVQPLPLEGEVRDPALSPDSTRIAYIRREESYSDLYMYDLQTGQATQVTYNGSQLQPRTIDYVHSVIWAAKPAWSPDGQELVFLSQVAPATGAPSLYEYPLAPYRYPLRLIGQRQPINDDMLPLNKEATDILSPAWSPDGRYLAYVQASRDEQPRKIMLYDLETGQEQQFPGTPDGAYDPAWSPDGRYLAFAIGESGSTDIWMLEGVTGGTPRRVTQVGRARAPVWSPGSNAIAFASVGDDSTDIFAVTLRQQEGGLQLSEPIRITEGAKVDATAGLSWGR
jgi:TolB protein